VIVSEALATEIWEGENPIGKRVRVGGAQRPWREVVGVAGNVRHVRLDDVTTRQVYIPERQWPDVGSQMVLVVRTQGDVASLAPRIREAVRSVDPTQPIVNLATMSDLITRSTAQRRFALLLFAAFGVVALLLASAGIYGVLAGRVAERTREIGLRSALGATPADIIRMVMREGALLTGLGIVLGVGGALTLSRFLEALLYGVAPADPATIGSVAAVLSGVALVACLVPALRAIRIDPMAALRAE
jgi:putative ABC transport system permease protein